MAGKGGHHLALDVDRGPQKTDDRPWSSYIPGPIKAFDKGLRSILTGDQRKVRSSEHSIIQTKPKASDIDKESWETVELPKVNDYIIDYICRSIVTSFLQEDELVTLRKDHADSLLRIADLERQVQIAEESARLKESAIADLMEPQKQKSGRKKSKRKHDIDGGAQLIAKIDDFQKTEEKLTSDLKQKEEQRYQATQQVLTLREELSSSRHHIDNLQQRYKEMVDEYQKMEGEMKQLLEITPEDIPEDVDVKVLVSQLRARLSMFERENQQVKVHTKQQSRQIQIMKQQEEGIEVRMYMYTLN